MSPARRFYAYITMIAWNIYVGTPDKVARAALRELIERHRPEVLALMEATNLYGNLGGFGYQVVHLKPRPSKRGQRPAQGNIAILVRNDVEIKATFVYKMTTFWKFKRPQDPRVYRWVLLKHGGRTWKVGVAHTPFGTKARRESKNKLVQWFKNTMPGRPTVLLIDSNMSMDNFKDQIAEPVGAKVGGHHIDVTAYKNCQLVNQENLGKGVSDHPAMKYRYRAFRRKKWLRWKRRSRDE